MDISTTSSIISAVVAVVAIALFLWAEILRRPVLDVEPQVDTPGEEDDHLYLHLNVTNRMPPWMFSRDLAVDCTAYVSYLDPDTRRPLVGEVTAKWASRPNPIVPVNGAIKFAEWLIPTTTRMNVGFLPEKFDVFIKWADDGSCYAANPWKVFGYPRNHPEYARLRLPKNECIVRVELEAANLGRRATHELRFENTGPRLADYRWGRLAAPREGRWIRMPHGQRWLLWIASAMSLIWGLAVSIPQTTWAARSLPEGGRLGLALLLYVIAFISAFKALGR